MKKTYIIILLICAFLLSIIFAENTFAGDGFLFNKKFTNHTYIGPFNISSSDIKQAESKLASDLAELQNKLEVNLIYQDTRFSLPPETITFDIDMTLENAQSSEDNPIIAIVSREGLNSVLLEELSHIQFSEHAIDSITRGIEKELQTGIMPSNVYITDYLGANEISNEVLASSEYDIEGVSPALSKGLNAIDQFVIQPSGSFSMWEMLTTSEVGTLTDEEMTMLSSILYSAILQTNFQIDERNISTVLPSNIQPGYEAAMNQILGLDFKFTNPNKTEFTIRAAWTAGTINLSIEGQPFYYTYEPVVTNIETFKPRTVRQYSAFVDDGQVIVSQVGREGLEVIVKRTLSVNGQIISTEDISEDFYAPIHRIEIHPLSKGNTSVTETTDGEEPNISQNGGTDSEAGTEDSNRGEMNTGGYNGSVNINNSVRSKTEDGNVNDEPNEGEIIYDKSGLPISGK